MSYTFQNLIELSLDENFNLKELELSQDQLEQLIVEGTNLYNLFFKSTKQSIVDYRVYIANLVDDLKYEQVKVLPFYV
jgi:adenosine deaminase